MPTQGFNIKSIEQNGFKLNVWDIGGQKTIRPYWNHYYKDTDALVYVIDSSDRSRLSECGELLFSLLNEAKLESIPLCIIANKQDVINAISAKVLLESLNLHNIRDRDWHIFACSAKTGKNLQTAISWLINKVDSRFNRLAKKKEQEDLDFFKEGLV